MTSLGDACPNGRSPRHDYDRPISTVTFAEIAALPVMVDLLTAGRVLGIGRTTAYALVRAGEFPCPVVRVGAPTRCPLSGCCACWASTASAARRDAVACRSLSGCTPPRR